MKETRLHSGLQNTAQFSYSSTNMATASELRQILKEDAAGKNLYDHLTETLMRIVMDRPANAYDAFELISADIKSNPLNPDPEAGKPVPPSDEEVRALTPHCPLTLPVCQCVHMHCRCIMSWQEFSRHMHILESRLLRSSTMRSLKMRF